MTYDLPTIRVFLSSPGDVPDERDIAEDLVRNLGKDIRLRDKLSLQIVAWDRHGGAPMPTNLTPQEAINRGMPKPSECDIVVVILWSRIGTLLPTEYIKPNGERYASGTEWEFIDAMNAPVITGKTYSPNILLYRCMRDIPISVTIDEKTLDKKVAQLKAVQHFFNQFENEDGSISGSAKPYGTLEDFRTLLNNDLRGMIKQIVG